MPDTNVNAVIVARALSYYNALLHAAHKSKQYIDFQRVFPALLLTLSHPSELVRQASLVCVESLHQFLVTAVPPTPQQAPRGRRKSAVAVYSLKPFDVEHIVAEQVTGMELFRIICSCAYW